MKRKERKFTSTRKKLSIELNSRYGDTRNPLPRIPANRLQHPSALSEQGQQADRVTGFTDETRVPGKGATVSTKLSRFPLTNTTCDQALNACHMHLGRAPPKGLRTRHLF